VLVVDEHYIGVAALANIERLSCADRHHFHLNASLGGKARQQETKKA
jgi:hypothetical protein